MVLEGKWMNVLERAKTRLERSNVLAKVLAQTKVHEKVHEPAKVLGRTKVHEKVHEPAKVLGRTKLGRTNVLANVPERTEVLERTKVRDRANVLGRTKLERANVVERAQVLERMIIGRAAELIARTARVTERWAEMWRKSQLPRTCHVVNPTRRRSASPNPGRVFHARGRR